MIGDQEGLPRLDPREVPAELISELAYADLAQAPSPYSEDELDGASPYVQFMASDGLIRGEAYLDARHALIDSQRQRLLDLDWGADVRPKDDLDTGSSSP